jgi:hypothetical protein
MHKSAPFKQTVDSGAIDWLIKYCSVNFPKLQYEAAWCLTNIASCEGDYSAMMV